MAPLSKFIDLPDGLKLHYAEQGDPSGVPLVLLHGVTDSLHSFDPVLPNLPESLHAFSVTQRGHGDSDHPPTGYRTRDFASDVAAFVDALKLGRVVVVGHSMGSVNAVRFAIDYPDRISGLVLIDSFASFRNNKVLADFTKSSIAELEDPVDPGFVREFQESTLFQPIPAEFLELVINESLKVPARVWREVFEGFMEDDFVNDLGKITAPTLMFWGDQDQFSFRADQEALLKKIPGSKLLTYEGTGHALHWEEPERFASDLVAFVESLTLSNALSSNTVR